MQDNATSLLHYAVNQYIKKFEGPDAGTDKVKYLLPDPGDLHQASLTYFDELEKELRKVKEGFDGNHGFLCLFSNREIGPIYLKEKKYWYMTICCKQK